MSDQQRGHADLSKEPVHALDKVGTCDGVEGSEGLVEENDLRLRGQRACQGHSLPLTTRELARPAVGEPVGCQAHEVERHGGKLVRRRHTP